MNQPLCPRCGAVAQTENARFCGKCGYRFPDAAVATLPQATSASPVSNTPSSVAKARGAGGFSLLQQKMPKPIFFGLNGALGCLIGALLGEIILALFSPPPPPPPPPPPAVDVMFVVDKTMSMTEEIDGVKEGIKEFSDEFNARGLLSREGILAFGDRFQGTEPQILQFGGEVFTNDTAAFRDEVAQIEQVNGGDIPESSLDALAEAARQPFRPDAKKILILITDAAPQLPDKETTDPNQIAQLFKERHIDQFHIVTKDDLMQFYTPLQSVAAGQTFTLDENGRSGFDRILQGIGSRIAESLAVRSVSGNREFDASQARQVLLLTACWTALLAVGVTLWLIVGQKLYQRQPFGLDKQIVLGVIGGILAGLIAGGAGQLLFTSGGQGEVARVMAWTLLGACIGWGISFVVPNLGRAKAALGGALGGFVGVIAFVILAGALSETWGRLSGATILGFCIGLMLALIELVTRKAWIEVQRGDSETWIVNLGEAPVRVGSREISEIYVRQTEPDAYRFRLDNGKVLRDFLPANQTAEVRDGDTVQVGDVLLTVRTQTGNP